MIKLQKKTINDIQSAGGYASHLFEQSDFYPLFDYDKNYLPNFSLPKVTISQIKLKDK